MREHAKAAAPAVSPGDLTPRQARAVRIWRRLNAGRPGQRGYLCVLGFIAAAPATAAEVSASFGIGRQVARELLKRAGELGLAHQAGERRTGRAGTPSQVWAYGPGPAGRRMLPSRDVWSGLVQLAAIMRALGEGVPLTPVELREATGSNQPLLLELLEIGRALRLMRVADWSYPDNPQGGGSPRPCWALGRGPSVPRPPRVDPAETIQRKRQGEAARAHMHRMIAATAGGAA